MGCGAVCGDSSIISQPNQYSLQIFLKLIPKLNNINKLISQKQFNLFLGQIKQNPHLYRLKLKNKLTANVQVDPRILRKWKIILFCHQNENINFINCLGYKSQKINKKNQQVILEENNDINSNDRYFQINVEQLKEHKDFKSIRNDIDRTSNIPQNKKKQFQNVLKRITNQFPQLGYTQGMNFLIAYFLKIGYSQFDTFWIFSHIAINKRFLLLGLFQDSFPLVNIYLIVFKNLLKRQNNKLYEHIYEHLKFPQHQWLFKWFITLFLYNFPIQMVTYAFDIIIDLGSIGIINFTYGILQQLSQLIYQQNDHLNLFQQFSNLRFIDYFNQHINIKNAVEKAYKVKVKKQDFQGIQINHQIFFNNYILTKIKQESISEQIISFEKTQLLLIDQNKLKQNNFIQNKQQLDSEKILNNWYKELNQQRKKFLNPKQQNKLNTKPERSSIQEHFSDLLINEKRNRITKEPIIQQIQYQNKNSIKDSDQIKNDTTPSTGYSFNKKSFRVNNPYLNSQIDELWDQQDSNSCLSNNMSSKVSQHSKSQQDFDHKISKPKYQDQLDKLAATQNINSKIKYNQYQKTSSINPRINNYQLHSESMKSTFLRAGSNILNNNNSTQNKIIFDSSNSQSSKNSNCRQKKQKQNGINIQISNVKFKNLVGKQAIKLKTQDKKSVNDQLSQNSSSLDPKNSVCVSNDSIQQQIRNGRSQLEAYSMKKFDTHRQKNATHQDILIDSYEGLKAITNNSKHHDFIESQIQIFQANQVFKKKNRISSRINGGINSAVNQNMKKLKLKNNISDLEMVNKNERLSQRKDILDMQLNYEQSCQSFFVTSRQMDSKVTNYKQQIHKYQIESVK